MKRRIAVLACGWSTYFLKDFMLGMKKAVEGKDIDIYLFEDFAYRLNKKIEDFSFFNLEVTATIKNTIYQY